jgi:hypothetical protein
VLTVLPYLAWSVADKLAAAFVSPVSAAVLSLGILVFQIPNCQTIYVRAYKREPFLIPSLIVSGCIATSVTVFGIKYGIAGAAIAWTACICVVQLPLWTAIWRKAHREWHIDTAASSPNQATANYAEPSP